VRIGQGIEQCRLARIRVSDERDGMELACLAILPMQRAAGSDMLCGFAQPADASANAAAIKFQLLFTGSPGPDATTQTRQQSATPGEAGQQVIQLGKLDLKLAFATPSATRKNVQYKLRTIENLEIETLFKVSELGWRQIMVEDYEIRAARSRG
jgi:hypothetical protein